MSRASGSGAAFHAQPWEAELPRSRPIVGDDDDDDDVDEVVDDYLVDAAAGEQLTEAMLTLYFRGKMTAKDVCTLAWWSARAGAKGPIGDLGYRPSADPGKFQRKLDKVFGLDFKNHRFYDVDVPGFSKATAERTVHTIPVRLPHEVIEHDVASMPDLLAKLEELKDDMRLPPAYLLEKAVAEHPDEHVLPLAIFIDGLKYTRRGNMTGFFMYDLVTQKRHLLATLRKSDQCRCGCGGRCSTFALMDVLKWSIEHCVSKTWPERRHDGADWDPCHDVDRSSRHGQPLSVRSCVLFVKGDWAEFSHNFGYLQWNSLQHPCPFCKSDLASLYNFAPVSFAETPWESMNHEGWEEACASAEIRVTLTLEDHTRIKNRLFYDRRTAGNWGRCLTYAYERLGLRAGDRLEPTRALPDVAAFDAVTCFPMEAVFWRRSTQTKVNYRCGLFGDALRTDRIQIDIMHTVYLGCAQDWLGAVCWHLIYCNTFRVADDRTEQEKAEIAVDRLRVELKVWYARIRREGAPSDFTPLDENFDWRSLGTSAAPKFVAKAAQTKTVLPFFQSLLEDHKHEIGQKGAFLLAAGAALLEFIRILREAPSNPDRPTSQVLADCFALHSHVRCSLHVDFSEILNLFILI